MDNGGLAKDGTWVIWKLKRGVQWHDGKPFTADDVVFNWEYVADPATAPRVVGAVLGKWGRLDVLVNNAGVIRDTLFVRMDARQWDEVLETNLKGTFHFCKAVAEQMAFKQRSGRIINAASFAARL